MILVNNDRVGSIAIKLIRGNNMRYINQSNIKKRIAEAGKQCSNDFLFEIDCHIDEILQKCINQFNGHKVRLDGTLARFVLKKIK
jgi:enoyl-[acyl-carrier-protein] reductase (NADH)